MGKILLGQLNKYNIKITQPVLRLINGKICVLQSIFYFDLNSADPRRIFRGGNPLTTLLGKVKIMIPKLESMKHLPGATDKIKLLKEKGGIIQNRIQNPGPEEKSTKLIQNTEALLEECEELLTGLNPGVNTMQADIFQKSRKIYPSLPSDAAVFSDNPAVVVDHIRLNDLTLAQVGKLGASTVATYKKSIISKIKRFTIGRNLIREKFEEKMKRFPHLQNSIVVFDTFSEKDILGMENAYGDCFISVYNEADFPDDFRGIYLVFCELFKRMLDSLTRADTIARLVNFFMKSPAHHYPEEEDTSSSLKKKEPNPINAFGIPDDVNVNEAIIELSTIICGGNMTDDIAANLAILINLLLHLHGDPSADFNLSDMLGDCSEEFKEKVIEYRTMLIDGSFDAIFNSLVIQDEVSASAGGGPSSITSYGKVTTIFLKSFAEGFIQKSIIYKTKKEELMRLGEIAQNVGLPERVRNTAKHSILKLLEILEKLDRPTGQHLSIMGNNLRKMIDAYLFHFTENHQAKHSEIDIFAKKWYDVDPEGEKAAAKEEEEGEEGEEGEEEKKRLAKEKRSANPTPKSKASSMHEETRAAKAKAAAAKAAAKARIEEVALPKSSTTLHLDKIASAITSIEGKRGGGGGGATESATEVTIADDHSLTADSRCDILIDVPKSVGPFMFRLACPKTRSTKTYTAIFGNKLVHALMQSIVEAINDDTETSNLRELQYSLTKKLIAKGKKRRTKKIKKQYKIQQFKKTRKKRR